VRDCKTLAGLCGDIGEVGDAPAEADISHACHPGAQAEARDKRFEIRSGSSREDFDRPIWQVADGSSEVEGPGDAQNIISKPDALDPARHHRVQGVFIDAHFA